MYSIQSLFILFFIFFILSFFFFNGRKNNILYYSFFFILFLYAGFRPLDICVDVLGYQQYYEDSNFDVEISYRLISTGVKFFFGDFRYLLLIYAAIGVYLKFRAINLLSDYPWSALVVYYPTYYLLHEFTQIRAGIASGLLLIAIPYLKNRKSAYFFGISTIAVFFHVSAIIFYPLYFIVNDKLELKHVVYILTAFFLVFVMQIELEYLNILNYTSYLSLKANYYIESQASHGISLNIFNRIYLYKYGVLLFFIWNFASFKRIPYFACLLKIYALSIFIYLFMSKNVILAMRFSELLGVVEIILTPYIFYFFRSKNVGHFFIAIVSFSYLLISIYHVELIRIK